MAKHRAKKRNYKMINFKVYYDTDQDILDWWESIEEGDRSEALRDLIREQLGTVRRKPKAPIIDLPELMEVRRDTLWIRDALNDMPAYFERMLQQMAVAPMSVGQHPARAPTGDESALTDADAARRTQRMKKAAW